MDTLYPCCYPLGPYTAVAAETYRTPQKYVNYSYEFENSQHFDAGTYIAVVMDKAGATGAECNKGDVDQAMFVSILIENQLK